MVIVYLGEEIISRYFSEPDQRHNMVFWRLLVLTLQLLTFCPQQGYAVCYGEPWVPRWANETGDTTRDDLLCSTTCRKDDQPGFTFESKDYDKCCTCRSCTSWEGTEITLSVEFVSILGKSIVFSSQSFNSTQVYKIEHTDSEMTEFPSNLCVADGQDILASRYAEQFENIRLFLKSIVTIDFENNRINSLPDLNCLKRLDSLNVRNNDLVTITNTSFQLLTRLRNIDFSGNYITTIDPTVISSPQLNIFFADFSHNDLTDLDVSNMHSLYPFCKLNYESNEINELVNELDIVLNINITYGPGYVSLENNDFHTWPDFQDLLNLENLAQIGHIFSFGFDFRGIPLVCDCNLEPFMSLAKDVVQSVWLDYLNVTCTDPPKYKGVPVVNVGLSELICNVSEEDCPQNCNCTDKPNENTLYIDCHNVGLKQLPEIPKSKFSKYIALNVSSNSIEFLQNMKYLQNVSSLDISANKLKALDSDVMELLENATSIDISNNLDLRELPQVMQYHNVCARNMWGLTINCDCSSLWIEKWLRSKNCPQTKKHFFKCKVPGHGIKSALEFSESDLDCYNPGFLFLKEILLAALVLFLIIIGVVIYYFRYEILIIYLRIRSKPNGSVAPVHPYDVFISFNDEDQILTNWVNNWLEPNLTEAGYNVFQPSRDVPYGSERDSEVIHSLSLTRNFLCILSEDYLLESDQGMRSWTENEWKYGWNNFKSDRSKKIVIVNYDYISSFDVEHPQIRAFLRVGYIVDFKNQDRNIMEDIQIKLGKPLKKTPNISKITRFSKFDMFEVKTHSEYQGFDTDNNWMEDNVEEHENHVTCFKQQLKTKTNGQNNVANGEKSQQDNADTAVRTCQYRKCYACHRKLNFLATSKV